MEYLNSPSKLHDFIPRVRSRPLGLGLPWQDSTVANWRWAFSGFAPSCNCECGAHEQTANHIIFACPTHQAAYYQFVNDFNARGCFCPLRDKGFFSFALKEHKFFKPVLQEQCSNLRKLFFNATQI